MNSFTAVVANQAKFCVVCACARVIVFKFMITFKYVNIIQPETTAQHVTACRVLQAVLYLQLHYAKKY